VENSLLKYQTLFMLKLSYTTRKFHTSS